MELILFIAGFYCLFNGQFILALVCWTASHLVGKSGRR